MYVNPGYQKWSSVHKYVNQNKPVLKVVSDDFGALEGIWCKKSLVQLKCFTWWFH
jgi:hypothetical protein